MASKHVFFPAFNERGLRARFRDQFLPYTGLFDCSFKAAFDGTLFRLPFRTAETAAKSDISALSVASTPATD